LFTDLLAGLKRHEDELHVSGRVDNTSIVGIPQCQFFDIVDKSMHAVPLGSGIRLANMWIALAQSNTGFRVPRTEAAADPYGWPRQFSGIDQVVDCYPPWRLTEMAVPQGSCRVMPPLCSVTATPDFSA